LGPELLEIVDAEVYRAKGDGKNRIYMVDPWLPGRLALR
jgi:PleD family two-component response regulator